MARITPGWLLLRLLRVYHIFGVWKRLKFHHEFLHLRQLPAQLSAFGDNIWLQIFSYVLKGGCQLLDERELRLLLPLSLPLFV